MYAEVEACAAAKNVAAIACGIAVGLGNGDNALAALYDPRSCELGRVVCAGWRDPLTCMSCRNGRPGSTCNPPSILEIETFGEAWSRVRRFSLTVVRPWLLRVLRLSLVFMSLVSR